MPQFPQNVKSCQEPIFHILGEALSAQRSQKLRMANDKNGGPNHLKEWRLWKRMTLEDLADKVGTTASVIGYLESGERGLSAKWLRKLAPVLGTTPGMLLDHSPRDLDTATLELWVNADEPVRRQIDEIVKVITRAGGST